MEMEMDDPGVNSPREFNQLDAILKFFSEPIRYPPDAKMQDNISYEMFINICYHLPPKDLLMLACVCKHFRNMLDGNILPISWDIWKTSRERFTPFKDMDPPKGLNEQKFSRLLNFENGCEFCKRKDKRIQIYWVACVRSCKECLHKRAKSRQELEEGQGWKIESEVFTGTPHIVPCPDDDGITQYYWVPHITASQNEFLGVSKRGEWTAKKKQEIQSVIDESLERYHWVTRCWQERLKEQKDCIHAALQKFCGHFTSYTPEMLAKNMTVSEMSDTIEMNPFVQQDWDNFHSDLTDALKSKSLTNFINNVSAISTQVFTSKVSESIKIRTERIQNEPLPKKDFYGPPRQQKPKYNSNLRSPTNYVASSSTNSMHIVKSSRPNISQHPFWVNTTPHHHHVRNQQHKQSAPHNIPPQNMAVLNRRNEIVKHLKLVAIGAKQRTHRVSKMVPYTISIHDPLFRFLPSCSSFINPPDSQNIQDVGVCYGRDYIFDIIIPNLQREAVILEVSRTTESMHYILEVQGAIHHHLDEHPVFKCRLCPDCNPSVIWKMKSHLREVHALLSERDISKLYVDPDAVINYLHFAFVPEIHFLRKEK